MDKEGSMRWIFIVLILTLLIAFLWDYIPFIKDSVHLILNPVAGELLKWNLNIGMTLIVFIITLVTTLFQKYATDQKTLKEIKDEQKILQEEMKKFKDNPEKVLELQKKQFEFIPKTMQLTMRPLIYTGIPIVLFFRWFSDYFDELGNPKLFVYFSWFWFYLLASIIFSIILRKIFKVH
ncbi:MAG: EMC3/TMCO1 family protein [Candidatus Pacearchaeota archaeon]